MSTNMRKVPTRQIRYFTAAAYHVTKVEHVVRMFAVFLIKAMLADVGGPVSTSGIGGHGLPYAMA
ncbi:MAG: hypothetical protein H6823_03735 [Planctomycetaceae bacterium]|nr:hypothetical protein [Planctomycetaceae bacterium]